MRATKGPVPHEPHAMFRSVFRGWHARADVFSALPDAPVQPDDPPPWWHRLRVRRRQRPRSGAPSPGRSTAPARCGCPAPSGGGRT